MLIFARNPTFVEKKNKVPARRVREWFPPELMGFLVVMQLGVKIRRIKGSVVKNIKIT